jgi:iron complex transport system ATP-binding protein
VLARVDAALETLCIADLASRNLAELSGGQRQLVSLAQTLGREPDVMLLDEPTSALDLRHQYEVAALVRRVARARGLIALVSIHDINLALRFADRVLVLAEGRLVAFGEPRTVVTPRLLFDVYGVRARIEAFDDGVLHVIIA